MDPSLRFGCGHALYAMCSGFEFEQRKCAPADDPADDFLVSAVLAGALAQYFDSPALGLGIARVHPEQIACEQRRLVASRSGADLQEYVAVVVRVLRHQQALQLELLPRDARNYFRKFFFAETPGRGIRIRRQFV